MKIIFINIIFIKVFVLYNQLLPVHPFFSELVTEEAEKQGAGEKTPYMNVGAWGALEKGGRGDLTCVLPETV